MRLEVVVVGEGGGGTKEVGFCTLRPDLVMVTAGVATSLSLDEPSLPSSRLRLPPLPPPRPLPLGLPPRPRPRPDEIGVDCAPSASAPPGVALALGRLVRFPPLPPRLADPSAGHVGAGIVSESGTSFIASSLAASHPGGLSCVVLVALSCLGWSSGPGVVGSGAVSLGVSAVSAAKACLSSWSARSEGSVVGASESTEVEEGGAKLGAGSGAAVMMFSCAPAVTESVGGRFIAPAAGSFQSSCNAVTCRQRRVGGERSAPSPVSILGSGLSASRIERLLPDAGPSSGRVIVVMPSHDAASRRVKRLDHFAHSRFRATSVIGNCTYTMMSPVERQNLALLAVCKLPDRRRITTMC